MSTTAPSTDLRQLRLEALPPIPEHLIDFLIWLGKPSCILITGEDTTRHRIISTLLHGNEPSGAVAMHRWLKAWQAGQVPLPKTNISFILPSIEASLCTPRFNHRQFEGRRDLNRCFSGPETDAEGQLAANILSYIRSQKPEAILDLHNTSGSGPAFAVGTRQDATHQALASYFTQRMVFSDLKLGALTEVSEAFTPSMTIECGGAQDEAAHQLAYDGIVRFLATENPFEGYSANQPIDIYQHPLRLKLKTGCTIAYGKPSVDTTVDTGTPLDTSEHRPVDLTLQAQAESLNYAPIPSGATIGWLGVNGLEALTAQTPQGEDQLENFFEATANNELRTRQKLQLFMVTPRADIAMNDCVFYFVPI